MKSKQDIINMIKKDNENLEVKDFTKEILNKVEHTQVLEENEIIYQKHKPRIKWKFVVTTSVLLFVLLVSSLSFINLNKTNEPVSSVTNSKVSEKLGYQAVTLFNFAVNEDTKNIRRRHYTASEYDEIAKEINHYLLLSASILNGDAITFTSSITSNAQYNNNLKLSLSVLDYHKDYHFYFNEVKISEKKNESKYKIEGIIESDNVRYNLVGTREIKNDECETELKLVMNSDTNEYLILSQETEKHENEYSYKHYIGNDLYEEFEIEHEKTKSINKIEIEVLKNDKEYEYEFLYLNSHIETKYEFDNYSGNVKVYIENSTHRYVFSDYEKII